MPTKRYNKKRDCRFDDWRRNNVKKGGIKMTLPLYSSDLDCVEFIYVKNEICPVALIEKKSAASRWRTKIPHAMRATFEVARLAGLPYYVAVHNEDRSAWQVYHADTVDLLADSLVLEGSLFDYVMFLCELHNYDVPDIFIKALLKVKAISKDGKSVGF